MQSLSWTPSARGRPRRRASAIDAHAGTMIIEDQDAFKLWLTAVLKPLCDADPEALAKYVIALVKKDKSPEALHQSMVNQLQVFLQAETEPFVGQLFRTLETHDYIGSPTIPNTNPPNPALSKSELPTKAAVKAPIIPVAEIASALSETLNGKGAPRRDKEEEKARAEKAKERRRSRRRSLSRNRSRSRSWERSRRSRSRDKAREYKRAEPRENRVREWRYKSPTYRPWSLSPKTRSRSRSPRAHGYRGGGRYRNRSPPRSLSRSRSPEAPPKDKDDDCVVMGEEEKPVAGVVASAVVQPVGDARKRRCRDYDEEGYCMRGGLCPYDHGVDAVVLEDSALSRVLYPNGSNDGLLGPSPSMPAAHIMHTRPPPMPAEYNPQAPQMWHQRAAGGDFRRPGHRGGMNAGGPPRMPFPPPPLPHLQQRELIAVPVMGLEDGAGFGGFAQPPPNAYHPEHMFKKKHFDFNRLGPRQKHPGNCSLELKKIPTGLNVITHLNNHFVRFGKIVNIQVSFDGDPEAAIVTFSSHAEANAAYRSTEAVLNNRFIKVFWHATDGGGKEAAPAMQRSVKERLGQAAIAPHANKFLSKDKLLKPEESAALPADADKSLEARKEELKAQQTLAIRKSQEMLAAKERLKKNQEEKRKEAQKMTADLRKRKQDLLEKQIAQQKLLIDKMGKCAAGAQRDLLLQTIKKSQESIELMRKDLEQAVLAMKAAQATPTLVKRAKEAIQKELLDTELDIISKQVEGVDTSELQKKLWHLKAKTGAAPAFGTVAAVRGRGRGGRRFNPLAARRLKLVKNNIGVPVEGNLKAHAVDHRPTRLLVSGYEADEQENVLEHFRQFGEIADYECDDALPSVVINYKLRKEAELAFTKGKHFQDRTLSITWSMQNQSSRQGSRTVLISESDDDQQLMETVGLMEGDEDVCADLTEDVLLQDDEEEEEENEDRSWRR